MTESNSILRVIAICVLAMATGTGSLTLSQNKTPACADESRGKYIDIHVHANAWNDEGFTLEKLDGWMEANHVKRCIVQQHCSTLPRNAEERNNLIENFRKYQGTIYGFCVIFAKDVNNKKEVVAQLTKRKAEGAIGFGEHYGEGLPIDDPKNMILYAACAEVGLPVLFHMDSDNNKDTVGLVRLERVLETHPNCIFIAHAPGWWKNISNGTCDRLLQKYPNLYGDLSAGSGARAIGRDRKFGKAFLIRNADKLMFGTDTGPWSYAKEPAQHFALLDSFDLPDEVEDKIYRKNAERIFAFEPQGSQE